MEKKKKKILLIADNAETEEGVSTALAEYEVKTASGIEAAQSAIQSLTPDLIIIDFDLKNKDGLQVFKQIQLEFPRKKAIMLSISNDIPLAVSATKMGVAGFLRKPIDAKQLRKAVEENLSVSETVLPVAETAWLQGESRSLKKLYQELTGAAWATKNLILLGEPGINKGDVMAFLHANGLHGKRSLRTFDLSYYKREDAETHFWAAVQEIKTTQNEEDKCGSLFLDKIESVDHNFKLSILEYFRRKSKFDPSILVVLGMWKKEENLARVDDYLRIEIPPLRERKEDLPFLSGQYLKLFATKYNKIARSFSVEVLDYLMLYDYPGNYRELECIIEQALLLSTGESVELKDLPLDFKWILDASEKKSFRKGKMQMKASRREIEKNLYRVLLAKTKGDTGRAAKFLDIPRTAFVQRMEELGGDFTD